MNAQTQAKRTGDPHFDRSTAQTDAAIAIAKDALAQLTAMRAENARLREALNTLGLPGSGVEYWAAKIVASEQGTWQRDDAIKGHAAAVAFTRAALAGSKQ